MKGTAFGDVQEAAPSAEGVRDPELIMVGCELRDLAGGGAVPALAGKIQS